MNGYPRPDDVIFIQSEDVRKEYENEEWNGATAHVVTATFIKCDRPKHLMGIGGDEGEAVIDLYRQLRRVGASEDVGLLHGIGWNRTGSHRTG